MVPAGAATRAFGGISNMGEEVDPGPPPPSMLCSPFCPPLSNLVVLFLAYHHERGEIIDHVAKPDGFIRFFGQY
jgi:hypothetical protein